MELLTRTHDRVELQVLCDALAAVGIPYQVDDQGINALMPVPGLFDARLMVAKGDLEAARLVLADIGRLAKQ